MLEVSAKLLNWLFIFGCDIFLKSVHKFFRGIRKPAFTAGFFLGSISSTNRSYKDPRQLSDLVDIHILGFFQAENPHHQADAGHQDRVPKPVEDVPGVHHQCK